MFTNENLKKNHVTFDLADEKKNDKGYKHFKEIAKLNIFLYFDSSVNSANMEGR